MSAPNWLEALEDTIADTVEQQGGDIIQHWKDILQMAKDNIDAMEGH